METTRNVRPFGMRDKLGYLFGDFGNDFTFILSSSFLLKFYTDIMGVDAYVVKADISSEFQVQAMIEGVIEKYGQIDVLVNNAGIVIDKPLMDRTVEDFRNTVSVNLIGTFIVSKYASKWMLERKRGKITEEFYAELEEGFSILLE